MHNQARRRICLALGLGVLAPRLAAQPRTKRRVAVVCPGRGSFVEEMKVLREQANRGLKGPFELDWNFLYYDDDTQAPRTQARFIEGTGADLAVAVSTSAMLALAKIPQSIPVVFVGVDDPVGFGFVKSWARPGGNATGIGNGDESLIAKRCEFVTQVLPGCKRMGLIHVAGPSATTPYTLSRWRLAAAEFDMQMVPLDLSGGLDAAFELAQQRKVQAAMVAIDSRHARNVDRLIQFQDFFKVPLFFPSRWHVARGGLGAYGPSSMEQAMRAGNLIARVMNGEQPGQIPVELPTSLESFLSTGAIARLGIEVPQIARIKATEI